MKPLALGLSFLALASLAHAKVSDTFTKTYPIEANGIIRLENVNGSVEIIGWDKSEVLLEAEKTANTEEGLTKVTLDINADDNALRVKTKYEKNWKFWQSLNVQVHYKLKVPAHVTLEKIEVVNADVKISGVKGPVDVDSVNGSITATDLEASGKFDTTNGSITASYAKFGPSIGEVSLDTTNGSCTVKLPADAAFKLDASTVNGKVKCDFPITLEKSGRSKLRGTVNGGGLTVKLDSVNGGLSVVKVE